MRRFNSPFGPLTVTVNPSKSTVTFSGMITGVFSDS